MAKDTEQEQAPTVEEKRGLFARIGGIFSKSSSVVESKSEAMESEIEEDTNLDDHHLPDSADIAFRGDMSARKSWNVIKDQLEDIRRDIIVKEKIKEEEPPEEEPAEEEPKIDEEHWDLIKDEIGIAPTEEQVEEAITTLEEEPPIPLEEPDPHPEFILTRKEDILLKYFLDNHLDRFLYNDLGEDVTGTLTDFFDSGYYFNKNERPDYDLLEKTESVFNDIHEIILQKHANETGFGDLSKLIKDLLYKRVQEKLLEKFKAQYADVSSSKELLDRLSKLSEEDEKRFSRPIKMLIEEKIPNLSAEDIGNLLQKLRKKIRFSTIQAEIKNVPDGLLSVEDVMDDPDRKLATQVAEHFIKDEWNVKFGESSGRFGVEFFISREGENGIVAVIKEGADTVKKKTVYNLVQGRSYYEVDIAIIVAEGDFNESVYDYAHRNKIELWGEDEVNLTSEKGSDSSIP